MRSALFVAALVLALACVAGAQEYTTAEGLQKLVGEQSVPYFLVDVRTPAEFAGGHIPTAVNIPYESIVDKAPTADKAALIVVYCASGSRSRAAAGMLQKAGYTNVVNFGSIRGWKGEIVKP